MAGKRFTKGSEEWMLFNDFWKLCQDFWEPEGNQNYWDNLVHATNQFVIKYADYPLSRELALGLVCSMEEKYKNK